VLVIAGEPGIGKTALLEYADNRAAVNGGCVLRARGVESESLLAYAGLRDILDPLEHVVAGLSDRLRGPLDGILGRGPMLPGAPFAVGIATLHVLATGAELTPILLTIDDAQWLDHASRDALLFALRRLERDAVAAILCERTGDGPPMVGDEWPLLVLDGLDPVAARALLEHTTGSTIDAPLAERIVTATGGNPLALIEVARDGGALTGLDVDSGFLPSSKRFRNAAGAPCSSWA
jgi:hypothetical protein